LKVGDIPNSVKYLDLGYEFEQQLKVGDIPNSVKCIDFGNYSKPIEKDVIPFGVTTLIFYNKNIKFVNIPSSVTKLILHYDYKINYGAIPDSITKLMTGKKYSGPELDQFKKKLKL